MMKDPVEREMEKVKKAMRKGLKRRLGDVTWRDRLRWWWNIYKFKKSKGELYNFVPKYKPVFLTIQVGDTDFSVYGWDGWAYFINDATVEAGKPNLNGDIYTEGDLINIPYSTHLARVLKPPGR